MAPNIKQNVPNNLDDVESEINQVITAIGSEQKIARRLMAENKYHPDVVLVVNQEALIALRALRFMFETSREKLMNKTKLLKCKTCDGRGFVGGRTEWSGSDCPTCNTTGLARYP